MKPSGIRDLLLCASLLSLALPSCKKKEVEEDVFVGISIIQTAEIVPNEMRLTGIGEQGRFFVTALDRDGMPVDVAFRWLAPESSAIEFDDGKVVAKEKGSASIRAYIPGMDFDLRAEVVVAPEFLELRFLDPPADMVAGGAPPSPFRVAAVDNAGHPFADVEEEMVLRLIREGDSREEVWRASSAVAGGIALFTPPKLVRSGAYRFVASVTDLATAETEPFQVSPDEAFELVYLGPELRIDREEPFVADVEIRDVHGNLVPKTGITVALEMEGLEGVVEARTVEGRALLGPAWMPLELYGYASDSCWVGKELELPVIADGIRPGAIPIQWRLAVTEVSGEDDDPTWQICGMLPGGWPGCGDWGAPPRGEIDEPIIAVSSGRFSLCGIAASGALHCWTFRSVHPTGFLPPVAMDLPGKTVYVGAGDTHRCALLESGEAYCWGDGRRGQLGAGDQMASETPLLVEGPRFVSLSVGLDHGCGITDEGEVYCWGAGGEGRLGTGSVEGRNLPERVLLPEGEEAVDVSAGGFTTCARTRSKNLYCWGRIFLEDNWWGHSQSAVPIAVPLPEGLHVDEMGVGWHTPCLRSGKDVYCWGFETPLGDRVLRNLQGPLVPVRLPPWETGFRSLRMQPRVPMGIGVLESGAPFHWQWDQSGYPRCFVAPSLH